jgi:radical SAM superfamily enzyme YgiQ (UPF0313 family)
LDTLREGDLVGITSMTVTIEGAEQIARRAMKQGAGVVVGGVHATLMPEHTTTFAHSVMVGEGYFTWQQLIQDFAAEGIKGMQPVYHDETWADLAGLATITDRVIKMVDEKQQLLDALPGNHPRLPAQLLTSAQPSASAGVACACAPSTRWWTRSSGARSSAFSSPTTTSASTSPPTPNTAPICSRR